MAHVSRTYSSDEFRFVVRSEDLFLVMSVIAIFHLTISRCALHIILCSGSVFKVFFLSLSLYGVFFAFCAELYIFSLYWLL
jgi:hypothetical protein